MHNAAKNIFLWLWAFSNEMRKNKNSLVIAPISISVPHEFHTLIKSLTVPSTEFHCLPRILVFCTVATHFGLGKLVPLQLKVINVGINLMFDEDFTLPSLKVKVTLKVKVKVM